MTLEQEIRLAAKHAAQAAAQEAYEKAYKEAEKEKEIALKEAAIEGKLESARNFKKSGVSAEIISNVAAGDKLPKNAGEKFPLLGI